MPRESSVRGADVAIIGGSGLYELFESPRRIDVATPFGPPSAPISVGDVGGRAVAFLPRHGAHHEFPPHRVNHRANLWALRAVGVRRIIAPCAAGSLTMRLGPGDLVVPDQLVDRTSGRVDTFYDDAAVHVGFADPYCPRLRESLLSAVEPAVGDATMVVVQGPRFSTRAESQWYAAQGWSVVNMTGHPEAVLARELALCYASVALITDRDAGIDEGEAVDQAAVFAEFAENVQRLRGLLAGVVSSLPEHRPDCPCAHALDGIRLPFELP